MKPLPLPIRIAAGLVATAVEQAKELPRQIVELPVTAVSQTLQASMRVQQKVTELAIKGDRALSVLRPVEEKPSWATFDDDLPAFLRQADSAYTSSARRANGTDSFTSVADEPEAFALVVTDTDTEADTADEDGDRTESGPAALPEYATLTVTQVRDRIADLSADQLRELLDWELTHADRAPFVTLLGNRITTVTE